MYKSCYAWISSPNNIELRHEILSKPKPGQLLLKAVYSSVSQGTELALMAGKILALPQRLGYSMAAKVVAVGEGVSAFKEGDAVVATGPHASHFLIDERAVTPVPEGTDLRQAAFFNLAHTAMYGVRRTQIQLGESCLVMGQGVVGAITAQLARLAGAAPVVVTDTNEQRLDVSRQLGAHYAVNPNENTESLKEELSALNLKGFSVVIEATGLRKPLEEAFDWVAERGRVMMMSQSQGETIPNYSEKLMMKGATLIGGYINSKPFSLYRTDLEITGQWPPKIKSDVERYHHSDMWTSDDDIRVLLRLMNLGGLDLAPLITHEFNWRDIPDAYEKIQHSANDMLGVVFDWSDC